MVGHFEDTAVVVEWFEMVVVVVVVVVVVDWFETAVAVAVEWFETAVAVVVGLWSVARRPPVDRTHNVSYRSNIYLRINDETGSSRYLGHSPDNCPPLDTSMVGLSQIPARHAKPVVHNRILGQK
jgi:hypothetical protein